MISWLCKKKSLSLGMQVGLSGEKCHSIHSFVFKWYSQKCFLSGSIVKKLPANAGDMQEIGIQSLGWEDPLKEEMATDSNILA